LELVTRKQHKVRHRITHCLHGHEFTEANTYRSPDGVRHCKQCHSIRRKHYYHQRRSPC
jgi:hypothetical protein